MVSRYSTRIGPKSMSMPKRSRISWPSTSSWIAPITRRSMAPVASLYSTPSAGSSSSSCFSASSTLPVGSSPHSTLAAIIGSV